MTFKKKAGLGVLAAAVVAAGVYAKNYTMINLMGWSWLPYAGKALLASLSLPSLATVGMVVGAAALVAAAVYGVRTWRGLSAAFANAAVPADAAPASATAKKGWFTCFRAAPAAPTQADLAKEAAAVAQSKNANK